VSNPSKTDVGREVDCLEEVLELCLEFSLESSYFLNSTFSSLKEWTDSTDIFNDVFTISQRTQNYKAWNNPIPTLQRGI